MAYAMGYRSFAAPRLKVKRVKYVLAFLKVQSHLISPPSLTSRLLLFSTPKIYFSAVIVFSSLKRLNGSEQVRQKASVRGGFLI